jgi:hypothetical protein
MITVGGQFVPYTQVGEMVKQQWKKIGIDVDVKELERNLAFTRDNSNENQMITWANDGSEMLFLFPRHALPVDAAESHMGMAFAKWYASKGTAGKKPDDPELLRAYDLFRAAFGMKEEDRIKAAKELWKIIVEQTWSIGTVGQSPAFMGVRIVKNNRPRYVVMSEAEYDSMMDDLAEARLAASEADLKAGQATWLTTLNALRSASTLAAASNPLMRLGFLSPSARLVLVPFGFASGVCWLTATASPAVAATPCNRCALLMRTFLPVVRFVASHPP